MPKKKKVAKRSSRQKLVIPKSNRLAMVVDLVGTSPIVIGRFGETARKKIRDNQNETDKPVTTREPRRPKQEFEEATYKLAKGGYGVPVEALFKSILIASTDVMSKSKAKLRRNMSIDTEEYALDNRACFSLRNCGKRLMREDIVRIGMARKADLRYRPQFSKWSIRAVIRFDPNIIGYKQLLSLVQIAGESVGLLEGRMERTVLGWGAFRIESAFLTDPSGKPVVV